MTNIVWYCIIKLRDSYYYTYGYDLIDRRKNNESRDYLTYYSLNNHGSVVNIISQYTQQNNYSYDAFGNSTDFITPQTYNPFGYCGEYTDEETGFVYLRNRYYDPSIGSFITEDSAKDGLNWYAYCANDPVNYIDPLGLDAVLITADYAAGIGKVSAGHTSILTQDTRDGRWYYFYWGDKAIYFVEVPWKDGAMESLDDFNNWLDKQDLPYSTKNYTSATFVEGDFNGSVDYFKDLLDANCLQMTLNGFYKGNLKDGTNIGSFMDGQLGKTFMADTIPNFAEDVFSQLFFNRRFTRAAAKNDVTWEALYGSPKGLYKNKGLFYAETLGVFE